MRVYAESNFVLELALEQEQHQYCQQLVDLAGSRAIDLIFPTFAILEPYQTLVRRELDGQALQSQLQTQLKQLKRTASISDEVRRLQEAADLLIRAAQDATARFVNTRKSLIQIARMLPVDSTTLRDAEALAVEFALKLPDAIMLASVLADLAVKPLPSVFINRNTKDFNDPDIKRRLEKDGCKIIWRFDDGLTYITNSLAKAKQPS